MIKKAGLGVLMTAAIGLSGCGGGDSDGPTKEDRAAAAASASEASASAASASASASASAAAQEEFDTCTETTSGLMTALKELDSRLSVGLPYADYSEKVGDVQVAYDSSVDDILELPAGCLTDVGAKLEDAFNRYREVKDIWSDCIEDYDCNFGEGKVNARVQRKWAAATRSIEKADENLAALAP